MKSRAGDTAKKILDLAERYLMERGYHAFSYQHIAADLEVKPAAIHYHFRTRAELVTEVLARYRGRFRRWARNHEALTPAARLSAYIELNRSLLADGRIDPFGTLAGEYNQLPENVQDALRLLQTEISGWLAALLASGVAEGVFHFAGPAEDKAVELSCALLGAQQLGRVRGAASFEIVARQIPRSLGLPDSLPPR